MIINNKNFVYAILLTGTLHFTLAAHPPPRQLFFQGENSTWLGTRQGLCRYQAENELWSVIKSDMITDICIDEDVLWLGTSSKLYYADLRYLDWKEYTKEHGLPSDSIVRIVADLDYIYAAGSNGLARMDKLVEQWEPIGDFSSKKIYDLYSDQEYLWVATESGISYFEKRYEKWKKYTVENGLISNNVYRLFYFNDYLWALTDKGFSRYSPSMQTWNSYSLNKDIQASAITYLWVDAEYIWTVTPEGIMRFSAKNQTWENFSLNKPIANLTVISLSTSGKTSWFATSDGVYSFQEDTRRWTTYTAIEGLSDDVQEEILCIGQAIIAKKDNTFSVYFPAEDLWHAKEIALGVDKGAKGGAWDFYNNEKGLGFATPEERSVSLLGRTYFKLKNKADFEPPYLDNIKKYVTATEEEMSDSAYNAYFKNYLNYWMKAQLNLNADLKNDRTIRGTFDNTDPLGDLKYGLEYRGYGDKRVRRAGWLKDQRNDFFFSTLIDPTYMEGAGLRTEFGSRVGEKKRRRVNTGLWAGWRRTEYMKKLIPFQEDNFYYLNVNNIITESVELRIDGKLVDPREYSIERTVGLLTFKNEGLVNPDSYIEISFEYEPELGGHTNEMVSAENVVVFSDNVSAGINGVYRGIEEPDRPGTGIDTNRVFTGSVNGRVEYKSKNNKFIFKATPEVSTSYNDSIVVKKQGTGAKLDANAVLHNFKLKGKAQYFTPDYETLADITSIHGRMEHQGELEAVYDITSTMPITAGFSLLEASAGEENTQYLEYLTAPAGKPSLKLRGMRQGISCLTKRNPRAQLDSLQEERWIGRIETEWDLPDRILDALHMNKIWLNASYALNFTTDSTFDSTAATSQGAAVLDTTYNERFNHNLFGWFRILPHKKITLETKQIFRYFLERDEKDSPWEKSGNRYRPEFTLFSQELIPGITLYSKFILEKSLSIFGPDTSDTTGEMSRKRLNSSLLLIPGVWWSVLNPLQLNLAYNLSKEDSTIDTDNKVTDNLAQTYTVNPILDFGQDIHLSSRSEYSMQRSDSCLTGEIFKIYNDAEIYLRERKTKFWIEYDALIEDDYYRDSLTYQKTLTTTGFQHDFRFKWIERWRPLFRTELPINLNWQKIDSVSTDTILSPEYINTISPGVLIDWRIQKKFVREFRIRYFIGGTLYDGTFFDFDTYKKSWDNKLDMSLKMGRNFFLRMLLNVSYLYDEEIIRYDLAELKATALF